MMLSIRMVLYFLFSALASQGVGIFDAEAGTFTFQIAHFEALVSGVIGFIATFFASRLAKARGGIT